MDHPENSFGEHNKEIERKLKAQYHRFILNVLSLIVIVIGLVLCVQWFGWKLLIVLLLLKTGWEIKQNGK